MPLNSVLGATGWNVSLGGANVPQSFRRSTAVGRLFGGGSVVVAGAIAQQTYFVRHEAEGPFRRVRVHLLNADASATANFSCVIAATETGAETSASVRCRPVVGGTTYNTLAADAGSPGWRNVTFAGASSAPIPARTSTYDHGVLTSDWIDCQSVTRVDVATGRPVLLLRAFANAIWTTAGNITNDSTAQVTAWRNNQSATWYRIRDQSFIATLDGTTTLSMEGGSINNSLLHYALEFDYDYPALTVAGIGSSLAEGSTYVNGKYSPWQYRAAKLASSPTRPVEYMNFGVNAQTGATIDPSGLTAISTFRPNIIFHEAWNPNDGTPASNLINISIQRLRRTLEAARAVGSRVCVWSPVVNDGYTEAVDAFRLALKTELIAQSQNGKLFDILDTDSVWSNGATPARWITAMKTDNTHPSVAGVDAMANIGAVYIKQYATP